MQSRELDGIESAPGNARHPDVTVRPRLLREPRYYFYPVLLLLIGLFTVGRHAFARAGAANIYTRGDVAASHKIRMQIPIARERPIILAVRQVFENRGKFLARPRRGKRAIRHIKVNG